MKINLSLFTPNMVLLNYLKSSKVKLPVVYTIVLLIGVSSATTHGMRFDPPSLKLQLQDFDSRIEGNIFNVDFLLAHVLNNSRKTIREVGEITGTVENLLQNTTIFTNDTVNGGTGASAGSVVIPPGTTADTIIILNQNEGDSIAIQR